MQAILAQQQRHRQAPLHVLVDAPQHKVLRDALQERLPAGAPHSREDLRPQRVLREKELLAGARQLYRRLALALEEEALKREAPEAPRLGRLENKFERDPVGGVAHEEPRHGQHPPALVEHVNGGLQDAGRD